MSSVGQYRRRFQASLYRRGTLSRPCATTKTSRWHTVDQTCFFLFLMGTLNVTFLVTVNPYRGLPYLEHSTFGVFTCIWEFANGVRNWNEAVV